MELPDYEYKGLMAEAWDVLRGDTSQWADRYFFLDVIKKYGQPALDIGCGTGRLLLDYLEQGIDIDGVDNSPEMLALCRDKAKKLRVAPVLYEQYIESLALPRRYHTILIPSSSLQLIVDPAMVEQSLALLRKHLLPGSVIAASIMTLWMPGQPLYSEWVKEAIRAEDGAMFRRRSRSWYDPETECERTEDIYQKLVEEKVAAEEIHQRDPATRSYTQDQARRLFERSGFQSVELYHEFTFEPVKADDTLFVVVAHV